MDQPKPSVQENDEDLNKKWQSVQTLGGGVGLFLAFLNSGLPAIIDHFLDQVKPAIDIFRTYILTAPLSFTFTLLGLGLLRGWFRSFRQFLGFLGLLLLTSWWIGYALGWHPYFDFHDL